MIVKADMKTINETEVEATKELLVGRRIVNATMDEQNAKWDGYEITITGRLDLDDGTTIFVSPNIGGCSCGAGDYELTSLSKVDNIITDVRLDQEEEGMYRIFVYADNKEINAVQIEGDDGSGYYGTGYDLLVFAPGEEPS